jgi:hypothetical protein
MPVENRETEMRVAYQKGKSLFPEAEAEVEFLILLQVFSGVSNPHSDLHIDIERRLVGLKGLAGLVSGTAIPLIGLKRRATVSVP